LPQEVTEVTGTSIEFWSKCLLTKSQVFRAAPFCQEQKRTTLQHWKGQAKPSFLNSSP
jgi:hypothetical protein